MKSKSREIKLKHTVAFKDLCVIISIGILLFAFAFIFHVFERFAAFHQKHGVGPIDDLIFVFAALAIVFAIFSLRRWKDLQKALDNIKTLQGFLPICASCKRVRDDAGYWNQLEFYIETHSEAELIHSICPKCMKKLYGITRPVDRKSSGSVPEGIEK